MLELARGFFKHHEPGFAWSEAGEERFGLLDDSPDRWHRFIEQIEELERHGKVKVVYLMRHGHGWHNEASQKYGARDYADKWAWQCGDGQITWGPDPTLTSKGEEQARQLSKAWAKEERAGMPTPESLYSSPLSRAAASLQIAFEHTDILKRCPPVFVEDLREGIGSILEREFKLSMEPWMLDWTKPTVYTEDCRSSKTELHKRFPSFKFEAGFSEDDERWSPSTAETGEEQIDRTRRFFGRLFVEDEATHIAISAHAGTLLCAMRIFGLPLIPAPTCAVLPLVIREL